MGERKYIRVTGNATKQNEIDEREKRSKQKQWKKTGAARKGGRENERERSGECTRGGSETQVLRQRRDHTRKERTTKKQERRRRRDTCSTHMLGAGGRRGAGRRRGRQ